MPKLRSASLAAGNVRTASLYLIRIELVVGLVCRTLAEMPTTTGRHSGMAHHHCPDGGTPGVTGNDPPATKKQYRIKLHWLEGKKRLDFVDVYDLRSPPSIRLD